MHVTDTGLSSFQRFMISCCLTIIIVAFAAFLSAVPRALPLSASPPGLGQKLNFPQGTRVVMIHADDAGISHSVNLAIERAFENHSISSASIIVPSPWFPEIAAFAKAHPEYDFGIHLALTSEWQYLRWRGDSPWDRIQSLLDQQGFLWASSESVAMHVRPEEARAELRAQIERALSFNVPITHLDTHMLALLSTPELAKIYIDLSHEYHFPILIWRLGPGERAAKWLKPLMDAAPTRFMIQREFPGPRGSIDDFPDRYKEAILNGKPDEVTELIVHPGIEGDELNAAIGDGSYGSSWRAADYRAITSSEMHTFLRQNNVKLVTWKQLAAANLTQGTPSE